MAHANAQSQFAPPSTTQQQPFQQQLPNQLQQPGINNQFPQPNQNPFQQQPQSQPQQGQQFLPPPTATYPPYMNQQQPPTAQFGPPQHPPPQQLFNPQFVVQCLDRILNDSIMNGNNSTGYIANQTKLLNSCIGR
jgi:hypothetical protein